MVAVLTTSRNHGMMRLKRTLAMAAGLTALALTGGALAPMPTHAHADDPVITVYKDPNCGCCTKWVEHLIKHGFRVTAKNTSEMTEIKRGLGVPADLESCHTGLVNGYVIEGHVPAPDIKRLLKEKPAVAGLAVPGMPVGSPGMEGPRTDRYDVLSFDKVGKTQVFAKH
jgi:hypothetical protein